MSTRRGSLLVTGAVLLLVGGGAAWYFLRDDSASEKGVPELVVRVGKLMSAEKIDRGVLQVLLKDIRNHPRSGDHPDLIRGKAQLLFASGSAQKAWTEIADQAEGPDASPEDQLLAAKILRQRHAGSGRSEEGFRAMQLARSAFESTNQPAALFLAWQMARRTGRMDEEKGFADQLQSGFGNSQEARMVAGLRKFFTVAPNRYDKIPELDAASIKDLEKLENELDATPAELEIVLAAAAIGGPKDKVDAGIKRLTDRVLKSYSSSIMGRMLAGIGLARVGRKAEALFHLDWLLQNHSDHPCAKVWGGVAGALRKQ